MKSMEPETPIDLESTANLVEAAQAGDRAAAERLFTLFAPRIRRIVALRMGRGGKALASQDDVVQEAMLKAYQGLNRFEQRSVGTFRNWLARCVETTIIDRARHEQAKKRGGGKELTFTDGRVDELSSSIFTGGEPTPSAVARGREMEDRIERALLQMDERYREVIILSKLCGMSSAEVAEAMGIEQEGTARQICFRAVHRLKQMLESDGGSVTRGV